MLLEAECWAAAALAAAGGASMGEPARAPAVTGLTTAAWRALARISGRTAEDLYDPLCFIENRDTDTQVLSVLCFICV